MTINTIASPTGWPGLFWEAFKQSKNAMVLLDDRRCHVEVNGGYLSLLGYQRSELIGRPVYELSASGPLVSAREWRALLAQRQFTGTADVLAADGRRVRVEFAGHPEIVTGKQLVLFVALQTRRPAVGVFHAPVLAPDRAALSGRELEVIRLLADGLTGPEVADSLQLAHNTIRTHVRNAMVKTGARSRAQLVAITLAEGHYPTDGR
jgi:PAS domain S-box-containing protein